ncbi:hypothetical protein J6590_040913 [Homalodisca vitripennis]|nr:hypothetical protein J6590_040913 [Homalodisca vitripennis]
MCLIAVSDSESVSRPTDTTRRRPARLASIASSCRVGQDHSRMLIVPFVLEKRWSQSLVTWAHLSCHLHLSSIHSEVHYRTASS